MTLAVSGVLVGGGPAIAHAAAASPMASVILGQELELELRGVELGRLVERERHRHVPGQVEPSTKGAAPVVLQGAAP